MKVDKYHVQSCCGKTSITLKLSSQVSKDFLPQLINNGFSEAKQFTASGMLYVENLNLIATGVFGSNNLQIKCKTKDCEPFVDNFINLLTTLG